jgi:carboxyl-terminal processing protease
LKRSKKFIRATALSLIFYSASNLPVAAGPMPVNNYKLLSPFKKVIQLIEDDYVDPGASKNKKGLMYGAIRGMLNTLNDPYTRFLEPEAFAEMQSETNGSFGGFGIYVGVRDEKLIIIAPIEDTPASRAGIKPGDVIVSIEGKSVEGVSLYDAVKLLKGPEGTVINFEVVRENSEKPVKYSLKREKIKIRSVKYALSEGDIGYIRISQFIETTAEDLDRGVQALEKQASGSLKGLILDLRNNPGGLLDAAVEVSERFLNLKKIVSIKARNEQERNYFSTKQIVYEYPLIVLVNKGSASASEIVSGALKDNKRALILGEKTYGKGCVQSVIELPDSSAVALTTAWYYTPSGRCIHEKGIKPDISVTYKSPETDEDGETLIEKSVIPPDTDTQYTRAHSILRGYHLFRDIDGSALKRLVNPVNISSPKIPDLQDKNKQ